MTKQTDLRYGLKLTPQYTTVGDLRAVWRIADQGGFDHCWTYDHFASIGADTTGDVFEGWMLLGAMAEATERVRIGCMVTGNTYRHPGVLAKMATTVDHLSGGRLEFGLGAAWAEAEHTMLGLHYGTLRERMDRFEEACQLIRSLFTEPTTTFEGAHYRLREAVANPKPVQRPHPPFWIGGKGRRRSLRITATYADAWNATGVEPAEFAELSGVLDEHCVAVGRSPEVIRRTIQLWVGPTDTVESVRRSAESYLAAGATDVVFVVAGQGAVDWANQLADLLPRLPKG